MKSKRNLTILYKAATGKHKHNIIWNSSFLQRDNIRHWKTHNVAMITGAKEQWATTTPDTTNMIFSASRNDNAWHHKRDAVAHQLRERMTPQTWCCCPSAISPSAISNDNAQRQTWCCCPLTTTTHDTTNAERKPTTRKGRHSKYMSKTEKRARKRLRNRDREWRQKRLQEQFIIAQVHEPRGSGLPKTAFQRP